MLKGKSTEVLLLLWLAAAGWWGYTQHQAASEARTAVEQAQEETQRISRLVGVIGGLEQGSPGLARAGDVSLLSLIEDVAAKSGVREKLSVSAPTTTTAGTIQTTNVQVTLNQASYEQSVRFLERLGKANPSIRFSQFTMEQKVQDAQLYSLTMQVAMVSLAP